MLATFSIVVSVAAFAVSVYALLAKRDQDRRDLFLKMHERLIDAELQEGRRLLRERIGSVDDAIGMRKADPVSYQLVGRALAMFDILGGYVSRGYVDRDLVLEEWGRTYAGCWEHGRHIVMERAEREPLTWSAWPHLQAFGEVATAWVQSHPRQMPPRSGNT